MRITLKPPTDDPERDLAEWVTAVGGRGTLLLANGGRRTFGEEITLPKMKFVRHRPVAPARSRGPLVGSADLDRLRGRGKLTSV